MCDYERVNHQDASVAVYGRIVIGRVGGLMDEPMGGRMDDNAHCTAGTQEANRVSARCLDVNRPGHNVSFSDSHSDGTRIQQYRTTVYYHEGRSCTDANTNSTHIPHTADCHNARSRLHHTPAPRKADCQLSKSILHSTPPPPQS